MSESISSHAYRSLKQTAGSTSCLWTTILVIRNCKFKRLNFIFQTFQHFLFVLSTTPWQTLKFLGKKRTNSKKYWSIVTLTNSKSYLNVYRIKPYLSNLLFCIKSVSLHQFRHFSVHIIANCHLLTHPKW